MGKNCSIFVCIFGLLAGCAETNHSDYSAEKLVTNSSATENSDQVNLHTADFVVENFLHLSFDDNYFMKKGQNFRIYQKNNEKNVENASKFQKKGEINHNAFVKCCYLGIWNGKHIITRAYNTGGSGTFTDIVQCSIEKENLHIDDVLMLGDRALDGIVGCSTECIADCSDRPYLDSNGKLYLKMRLSISTIASLSGISDRDVETGPFQAAQDFWNVSECIYNLETKKLEIVAMDINFEEQSTSNIAKILGEIFPNHGKTVRVEKNEIGEFLSKFKSSYLKLSRTTKEK